MEKLIITVAPTGSIPKKDKTPHVPITPQEITDCALRCEDAGASILHIHVRDEQENPSDDPELFAQVIDKLSDRTNLILQVSTGGRAGSSQESRIKRLKLRTEMASLTTGSVNFPTSAYVNPPNLVEALAKEMMQLNIKPEIEVFDLSMIDNAIRLQSKGLAQEPLHFNFVMGLPGAMSSKIDHLMYCRSCLPEDSTWTVSGIGSAQLPLGVHAILLGGHVRVGLEDNIYFRKGELATNKQLVHRMTEMSKNLEREVASADEARNILHINVE